MKEARGGEGRDAHEEEEGLAHVLLASSPAREVPLGAPALHVLGKRSIQNLDHTYTRRTIQIRTNSKQSRPCEIFVS